MTHHAVGVVGHIKRIESATALADQVEAKVLSLDPGRLGAGRNHLRVWQQLYDLFPNSSWLVVLEDDAKPVADFRRQLRMALEAAPTPIVGLYLGRYRPGRWQASIAKAFGMIDPLIHDDPPDPCFFTGMPVVNCVGLAVKTSLVPMMIDSLRMKPREVPVDEGIALWAKRRVADVAYTMPSLVDHNDELPTLITQRATVLYGSEAFERAADVRVAWRTGAREQWNSQCLEVPETKIGRDFFYL